MPDGDVFELSVDLQNAGQNMVNVHHFEQIGTDGTSSWQIALDAVWNLEFRPKFLAVFVTAVAVVQLRMRRIEPTQTQQTIFPIGDNGDILDVGLPTHSAAIVRQYAEPSGRKGIGQVKVTGVPMLQVDEGRVTAAYATDLNAYGAVFDKQFTDAASGYTFVSSVYSQIDNVARRILKAGATSRIKTVHSRQRGVGQ